MDIYGYGKNNKCNLANFMVKVKNPTSYFCIFIQHGKKVLNPHLWDAKLTYILPTLWKNKSINCHQLSVTNPD
jgi:hypothetical protein